MPVLPPIDPQYSAGIARLRRYRVAATIATWIQLPIVVYGLYLAENVSPFYAAPLVVAFIGLQVVSAIPAFQLCPRCRQSLVIRKSWWRRAYAKVCPACGLVLK